MISNKVLEDILEHPLGPYHDLDILHETECQMRGTTKLVLHSFVLEHDGHVIGLDESEKPQDEDKRRFRFRGLLNISNPQWLSPFGLKTVGTELNLRARERALREGERTPQPFTLEELFQNELLTTSSDATWRKEDEARLTVLIQGEKNMPAVFMHSSHAPHGLEWFSKAHNRSFQIETMDVETYSRSENFFWRWRLFALMDKIVKQYAFVPPKKRTPIWFVEKYMERFACPPEDRHRRLIGDEDDSDVDERGRTKTPRHLLKPHTSEMLGLFAAHAGWLVTHTEMRQSKLLDITSWGDFEREACKQRKEAAREGVIWGWPIGREPNGGASEEEDDEGSSMQDTEELVSEHPVIGKAKEVVARKLERARARAHRRVRASVSSGSGSEAEAPGVADYLSDFSEPSAEEEHDSDNWLGEEDVVDQIPWQLQLPPLLPDVDGRWWCPLEKECDYQIDLHNLTQEDKRGVPEDILGYILQKQWRNAAYDKRVLEGFKYMVTKHYMKHYRERGVTVEGRGRFTFVGGRKRRRGVDEPIRGPMPARGTLGGESRVIPIVHAPQAQFQ